MTLTSPITGSGNELPPVDPDFFRQHVVNAGARRVIAYLLAYVIGVGGLWTTAQLEWMLAQTTPYPGKAKRVEADRRARELVVVSWRFGNYKNEPGLRASQHRLITIGDHVWNLDYRWPQGRTSCPGPLRRAVLVAADYTCELCGIRRGEPHIGEPWRKAKMTAGRIIPGSAGGMYVSGNVRCECDVCNEWTRDQYDAAGKAA